MNKKGPWTIKDSKAVYENNWISVREDSVIRPDGSDGIFGVVTMKTGVSILPIDNTWNVYLTKEYEYAIERETIKTASGGIDKEESVLQAAKRELKEETGISAKEWIDLGFIDPFTAVINSPNYMYLARDLTFAEAELEGTETIRVIKIPFEQAIKWVMESKITHGATATLILKTKNFLGI